MKVERTTTAVHFTVRHGGGPENRSMLNRFAQALLAATSLAPAVVVYAVARLPQHRLDGARWLAAAALLVVVCLAIVHFAAVRGEKERVELGGVKTMDRDVLAFLVSYALPLIWPDEKEGSMFAMWTFIALVGVLLYQTGLVTVNPLLGLLGYRFLEVRSTAGETVVLITRSRAGALGYKNVVRLSKDVWLEVAP